MKWCRNLVKVPRVQAWVGLPTFAGCGSLPTSDADRGLRPMLPSSARKL